jgi:lipopolysaccharide transport system permease protein
MLGLRELSSYRDLLWMWTLREIKVRYKQSILGGAWAILQPLSLMLLFTIVFGYFLKVPTDGMPYPIFSYSALLPWTFFATSISFAVPSLVNNMNLVSKIYFPREILPIAAVGAALLDYAVSFVLFLVLMVLYQIPWHITMIWLPLLLAIQIVLTLGVSLLASAVLVYYRDVRFVVPLALQLWFYASPVIYPLSVVPERLQPLYLLNPMAVLIDSYRRITLYGQAPDWTYLLIAAVLSLLLFLIAYHYFRNAEATFADVI